jgi:hypothetical protein
MYPATPTSNFAEAGEATATAPRAARAVVARSDFFIFLSSQEIYKNQIVI